MSDILDEVTSFADTIADRIQRLAGPSGTPRGADRAKLDELVANAKKTNKRVAVVWDDKLGSFLFKVPDRPAEKLFRKTVQRPEKALAASKAYALSCVLHPSREQLQAVMGEVPGICMHFAEAIKKLARPTGDARGKA
jgi:hypothetical protein